SGGVDAVDLVAVRDVALAAGVFVARTTQPYRVAGRRVPPAPAVLDEAFEAIVARVRAKVGTEVPFVVGGRSSGARVACRTGRGRGPGGAGVWPPASPPPPPGTPEKRGGDERDPAIPPLVANGDGDPFGVPDPGGLVRVEIRPGDRHDLRRNPSETAALCLAW